MTSVQSIPTADVFAAARSDFAIFDRGITYIDVAARGIHSRTTRAAIESYLDDVANNGSTKDWWFDVLAQTRAKLAKLIGATADEIAFTKNVSEGLNIVANGLALQGGDNVIIAAAVEHPNNVYTWLNLRERGIEVRVVASAGGAIDPAAFADAIDDRTRLISVSAVTFAPGFRVDLAAISELCRPRNIFFLVDAAQSAGILHTDVDAHGVDGLTASTHKGILALYGMGFLFVRSAWSERMRPAYLARYAVDVGVDHEEVLGEFSYTLAKGSRRFEIGNYNYLGAFAANASLDCILALGTERIEPYVLSLAQRLTDGLDRLGLPVLNGRGKHLSNIVSTGTWQPGHYEADHETTKLAAALEADGIRLSIRRGMLRFSLHFYNNAADVDRALEVMESVKGR